MDIVTPLGRPLDFLDGHKNLGFGTDAPVQSSHHTTDHGLTTTHSGTYPHKLGVMSQSQPFSEIDHITTPIHFDAASTITRLDSERVPVPSFVISEATTLMP